MRDSRDLVNQVAINGGMLRNERQLLSNFYEKDMINIENYNSLYLHYDDDMLDRYMLLSCLMTVEQNIVNSRVFELEDLKADSTLKCIDEGNNNYCRYFKINKKYSNDTQIHVDKIENKTLKEPPVTLGYEKDVFREKFVLSAIDESKIPNVRKVNNFRENFSRLVNLPNRNQINSRVTFILAENKKIISLITEKLRMYGNEYHLGDLCSLGRLNGKGEIDYLSYSTKIEKPMVIFASNIDDIADYLYVEQLEYEYKTLVCLGDKWLKYGKRESLKSLIYVCKNNNIRMDFVTTFYQYLTVSNIKLFKDFKNKQFDTSSNTFTNTVKLISIKCSREFKKNYEMLDDFIATLEEYPDLMRLLQLAKYFRISLNSQIGAEDDNPLNIFNEMMEYATNNHSMEPKIKDVFENLINSRLSRKIKKRIEKVVNENQRVVLITHKKLLQLHKKQLNNIGIDVLSYVDSPSTDLLATYDSIILLSPNGYQVRKWLYSNTNTNFYVIQPDLMNSKLEKQLKKNIVLLKNIQEQLIESDHAILTIKKKTKLLLEQIKDFKNQELVDEREIEDAYLPLYSYKNKNVELKSGLNAWNAAPKNKNSKLKRPEAEVYIPVPKEFCKRFPFWFDKKVDLREYGRYRSITGESSYRFNLHLPNGQVMPAFIGQQGFKGLQTDPQSALGKWLLYDVLKLSKGEIATRIALNEAGVDSVRLWHENSSNKDVWIDVAPLNSFEQFIGNQIVKHSFTDDSELAKSHEKNERFIKELNSNIGDTSSEVKIHWILALENNKQILGTDFGKVGVINDKFKYELKSYEDIHPGMQIIDLDIPYSSVGYRKKIAKYFKLADHGDLVNEHLDEYEYMDLYWKYIFISYIQKKKLNAQQTSELFKKIGYVKSASYFATWINIKKIPILPHDIYFIKYIGIIVGDTNIENEFKRYYLASKKIKTLLYTQRELALNSYIGKEIESIKMMNEFEKEKVISKNIIHNMYASREQTNKIINNGR